MKEFFLKHAFIRFNSELFVLLILIAYFCAMTTVSLIRFWTFQMNYYDFGLFDSAIWQVSQFNLPLIDKGENGRIIFGDHFNPSMFLLSPLFWITDRSEILLIVQTLSVTIAGWVGYQISKQLTSSKSLQIASLISFLGFVGTQNALITEIHDSTYAVLPLMIAFWAIINKKWKIYLIAIVIFTGFKESHALTTISCGFFLLFYDWKKNAFIGAFTILFGTVWSILAILVIIPYFSGGIYDYNPQHIKNVADLFTNLLDHPLKRETVIISQATFGLLPLGYPPLFPMIFEQYFTRFVLSSSQNRWDLGFHYNALIAPILFISSLFTIQKLEKKRFFKKIALQYAIIIILFVLGYSRFIYHGPIHLFFIKDFYTQLQNVSYQNDFVKLFPKQGIVMTQNDLATRLTHGPTIRLLRLDYQLLNPDYIILNLTPGQNPNSYTPLSYSQAIELKDQLINNKNYRLQKMHNDQYLFEKIK